MLTISGYIEQPNKNINHHMLNRIKNFESFSFDYKVKFDQIHENLKAAKIYMQKEYADRKSLNYKELTPEQRDEALNDPAYKKILDLIGNNHGYAGPFVKFHFEQGVPIKIRSVEDEEIRDLTSLLNVLLKKKHLVSRLPMEIEQYASLKKEGIVTGFEKLTDAIRTIEREDGAKWLIDRFPLNLRNQYRKLSREEQNPLINAAYALEEHGEIITERLLEKIKAMVWDIHKVIDYINEYLYGYDNADRETKMKDIKKLSPQAGVLYFDDKYLAISVRTEEAQKKLCSIANWCINRGDFEKYKDKAVQINIFDYTKDLSDPLFLTGTTIKYDGDVSASHDINDVLIIKSKDYMEHFRLLGYPDYVLKALANKIPLEILHDEIMDEIGVDYSDNARKIVQKLIKIKKQSISGEVSDEYWNKAIEIVSSIVKENIGSYRTPLIELFTDAGIMSYAALEVFNSLIDDVTKEEAKKIIDITEETLDSFEDLLTVDYTLDPSLVKSMKEILKDRDEFMIKLKADLS